ncbi:MAG: DUF2911 domain-containing protein [Archangium sp.]|nr:DUF2911 domain-containing protein [Archangium sp.]MDP3151837.1 DUF2911 domain-containing protein [Archangium sp.]MDP3569882.1 DUF2911 domain-containing protein [Archangium sp.]
MKLRLVGLLALLASPAFAQLKLPPLSPEAKIVQNVGLTTITIDYSSPAVKGRKIWGGLVPMDKVWRAGANHSTTINFTQPVMIGDKEVAAGTYGFFAIPGAASWTLIVSKANELWGSDEYKPENDIVRVTVKPTAIPNRERLVYLVTNFTNETANIDLEWEKVRVTLPVKLKTAEQAAANIKAAVDGAWQPMNNAARYALEIKDYANALIYVDKSIAAQETWFNTWVKAQILSASGKKADALVLAQKAQTLGEQKPDGFFYAADVKKALTEWKGK